MGKHRINLTAYGISPERMNELRWFARQYDQLKYKENMWRLGEVDRKSGNGTYQGNSSPTEREAIRLATSPYARKIAMIEQSAVAADPGLSKWILLNVARGIRFESMAVPCGRRQFFEVRRRFFIELDGRMK